MVDCCTTLILTETCKCWNKPFQTSVTSFISVGKSLEIFLSSVTDWPGVDSIACTNFYQFSSVNFSFQSQFFLFFILVAQWLRVNLTPVVSPYMYKLATYVKTLNNYSLFYFILLPREFVTSMTDRTGFWRESSFSFSAEICDSCHQSTA